LIAPGRPAGPGGGGAKPSAAPRAGGDENREPHARRDAAAADRPPAPPPLGRARGPCARPVPGPEGARHMGGSEPPLRSATDGSEQRARPEGALSPARRPARASARARRRRVEAFPDLAPDSGPGQPQPPPRVPRPASTATSPSIARAFSSSPSASSVTIAPRRYRFNLLPARGPSPRDPNCFHEHVARYAFTRAGRAAARVRLWSVCHESHPRSEDPVRRTWCTGATGASNPTDSKGSGGLIQSPPDAPHAPSAGTSSVPKFTCI
jgi:hypothetical protein